MKSFRATVQTDTVDWGLREKEGKEEGKEVSSGGSRDEPGQDKEENGS